MTVVWRDGNNPERWTIRLSSLAMQKKHSVQKHNTYVVKSKQYHEAGKRKAHGVHEDCEWTIINADLKFRPRVAASEQRRLRPDDRR